MIILKKHKSDIENYLELLGRLDYQELEMLLNDLYKFEADELFIQFTEMELLSRSKNFF